MRVIFFDIDGVLCIAQNPDGTGEKVMPSLCRNLARLAVQAGATMVISSDWRLRRKQEEVMELLPGIPPELMHSDPLDRRTKSRWMAIKKWLEAHPDVTDYVIIDDTARHFDDAPDYINRRLILCDGRQGVVGERVAAALRRLEGRDDERRQQFTGGDVDYDADL
jgi:hypothetical protein